MVADELAGPPPVTIHTTSNSCIEPIIDRKIQIRIVGPSSGIVILRWACHQLAPSIAAASCSSSGTFCRPARNRSEEHTSELQSLRHLVCRLLLEKKKKKNVI